MPDTETWDPVLDTWVRDDQAIAEMLEQIALAVIDSLPASMLLEATS